MPGPEEQQNGSHRALVPHRPVVAEKMILLLWRDQFQTVLSGLLAIFLLAPVVEIGHTAAMA